MSNNTLRYAILAGLFAVPFVPFIISSSLFFPFITGKAFIFRFIVEVVFALYLVLAIRDKSYRPKFTWILGSLLFFLAAMALATIFAENPFKAFWSNYERMEGYISLLHFGAYFLVMGSVLKTREIWDKLLATSLFGSFIMSVYSFFQLAGKITINQGGVRVDGTLGNASYLAIYMVFHIFIAALLYFRFQKSWQRALLGLVAILNIVTLYFTATRGAILGLLGGAFLTFLFLVFKSEKGAPTSQGLSGTSRIRKVAGAGLAALILLAGLFFALRGASFVKNSPVLARFSSLSFSEIKTQGRYYVWPMAIRGFLERPITGWGQEGFNFVFNKYYDPRMYNQEQWFDRAHSAPLDWLVAGGALGFLSYAFIFLTLFIYIFRSKGESLTKNEKGVMLGLVSAYIFNNLFVFDQISSYILFFTVLAFMHSHAPEARLALWQKLSSKSGNVFESEKNRPIAEALIVILTILILYFAVYQPWQQNKSLLDALRLANEGKTDNVQAYLKPLSGYSMGFSESLEHISQAAITLSANQNTPAEFKQKLAEGVDGAFKKQLARVPDDARYRLFYGLFLSRLGNYDKALEQLKEAQKLSPKRQQVYFELVNNYLAQNKPAEALAAAKTAFDLEPSYDEARFIYGLTLLSTGNTALSEEVLKGIPESKLVFDDRYIQILLGLKQYQKIIDTVKKRIELDPTNLQHRITLTAAYLEAGRRQEAIQTLEEVIRLNPSFKEQGEFYINEIKAGRNP